MLLLNTNARFTWSYVLKLCIFAVVYVWDRCDFVMEFAQSHSVIGWSRNDQGNMQTNNTKKKKE